MANIKEIFTPDIIEHYKQNKSEITSDLLEHLRSHGNEGKQIALDILDFDKDAEQYYIDSFNNRLSFNGNRRLKKSFSKLDLSEIHTIEIQKCASDIEYFKDNYIKIKTKNGVNFPDLREYQNRYIAMLNDDENEDIIGLMGRQSGKSVSTGIYLAHLYNFKSDLNMGIVANRGSTAKEILNTVKNIIISLPIWMQQGTEVWNKGSIENESRMRILTDVPTADAFTGFTMSVLVVDECAKIGRTVWEEFADSIFPSQSGLAWKKNIIISTAYGMNHYYEMVKGARAGTNGMQICEVDWREVPRYNSKGELMQPEEFMNKIVKKHGIVYWNQNYANQFLGSSHTLIPSEKLQSMKPQEPILIRDNKLKIYKEPEKGHNYIMSIDSAKDGTDAFAVQIVDITDFEFEQVACCNLQIDYLLMPEYIDEWCEYYNNPYLIIENNEGSGQSIADQLYQFYEYENIHFDYKAESNSNNRTKSRKKYPGFRTTTKTRKQILQTLKLFIENDKLKINDSKTIDELMQFILIKNKYQADEGAHDDMVMSLAMIFVPFCNTKNFENMKLLVQELYSESSTDERKSFSEHLIVGSFDDGSEYITEEIFSDSKKEYLTMEDYLADQEGFFVVDISLNPHYVFSKRSNYED